MNPETRSSESPSGTAKTVFSFGKKALACSLAYLMIPLGMGDIYAYAQSAPPPPPDQQQQYDQGEQYDQGPPPESYNVLSPDQLDKLVAPIALYPDSLVAQILAASTYPTEVADADQFLQSNQGAPPDQLGAMVNSMDWDPSIKALVAFPSVLNNMDRNLDWTSQLGNAYYNQPQDVMSSIQNMRQRAYEAGNLRSTQQLAVDYNPGYIVIAPANPAVVYVPWYDPWTIYGAPLSPWGGYYVRPRPAGFYFVPGLGFGFGVGIAVGHWNRWGWGYHNWGMGWRNRTIVYNQNIYISRSRHVRNHGYYGRFDRNQAARRHNRTIEVHYRNSHPAYLPGARRNENNHNNRNFSRPKSNVRQAPTVNRNSTNYRRDNNSNRPNTNRTNRPNTNIHRVPTLPTARPNNNRPANRPNTNIRRVPTLPTARPDNNRPANRPNTNRPNFSRPEPQTNVRRVPTLPTARPNNEPNHQPNFSRPNNERPNVRRPEPQTNVRRVPTLPTARPQSRPEARPQPRREAKPQQPREARPEVHARPSGGQHERGKSEHEKKGH